MFYIYLVSQSQQQECFFFGFVFSSSMYNQFGIDICSQMQSEFQIRKNISLELVQNLTLQSCLDLYESVRTSQEKLLFYVQLLNFLRPMMFITFFFQGKWMKMFSVSVANLMTIIMSLPIFMNNGKFVKLYYYYLERNIKFIWKLSSKHSRLLLSKIKYVLNIFEPHQSIESLRKQSILVAVF